MDSAQRNCELYTTTQPRAADVSTPDQNINENVTAVPVPVMAAAGAKCVFYGFSRHPRPKCPTICLRYLKKGCLATVCRTKLSMAPGTSTDPNVIAEKYTGCDG